MLSTADAHGPLGRSLIYFNCNVLKILKGVSEVNPTVNLLVGLLKPPTKEECINLRTPDANGSTVITREPARSTRSSLDRVAHSQDSRRARSAAQPSTKSGGRAEMQKRAPTLGNILVIILFVLSCFGLLMFLWESFGGPLPLKPKGYRFTVAFPRTLALAEQSDVRISGVNVGHVVSLNSAATGARTRRSNSPSSTRRSARTCTRSCARRRCSARPTCS